MTVKETTSEYALDDDGKMKLVKQKVNEKTIPPSADILKLIYREVKDDEDLDSLTDEELEREKQRLLKELKEEDNDSRKSKP